MGPIIRIYIEAIAHHVPAGEITVQEIMRRGQMPHDDRVYQEQFGGPDVELPSDTSVPVKGGERFFSTPRFINAG